jgi:aspartyl/glutamyl-tRNA(Asn/Gln) amidotransferase C subunit
MATSEDVKKLAALARISVSDEALPKFAKEFDAILGYVSKLNELTVEQGKSLLPYTNIFRADGEAHKGGIYTEKIAEQFPAREGNYLSVKQIIAHD